MRTTTEDDVVEVDDGGWLDEAPPKPPKPPLEPRARRRRRVLVAAGAVVAVALVVAGALASPLLDVDRVEVRGERRTPAEAVALSSGVGPGTAMVGVDPDEVAERVEALPWVAGTTVTRSWPDRVVIEVEERRPVGALAIPEAAKDEDWLVVDADGRRLTVVPTPPVDLVRVEGLAPAGALGEDVGPAAAGALELATLLPAGMRFRLPRVAVAPGGALSVRLVGHQGDVVAELGAPEQLRAKVVALATVADSVDLRGVTAIDVRVPSAPVIRRAPVV